MNFLRQSALAIAILGCLHGPAHASGGGAGREVHYPVYPSAPAYQRAEEALAKSTGCVSCHQPMDTTTMHRSEAVVIGCTDCHGGDPGVAVPEGFENGTAEYAHAKQRAHVVSRFPEDWATSPANPEHSYTLLNRDSPEYVRFVNPGDLRVAREACGNCHEQIIEAVERSLMSTTAMLWGGASYNNGILPHKRYILGEAYTREGEPAQITSPVAPTAEQTRKGVLPALYPLPAWETVPPADTFRVFERGGRNIGNIFPEIGIPNRLEEPGKPDIRQSNRGPGTGARISVPVLNVHKTRLNDPTLWFLGTNDNPGDFRSSGCSACHSVYANDRSKFSSGSYAGFGHWGESASVDPTIKDVKREDGRPSRGHPIRHEYTSAIPSSQCMVCHHHQPNVFVNSYLGFTMWDYESDAPLMWPEEEKHASSEEMRILLERNPEEAVIRGKWGDLDFLGDVWTDINPQAEHTQFADYHGHGWNFRAVHKRDRDGTLLDAEGDPVPDDLPPAEKWKRAVHMRDIHADYGMQCADCHFSQDSHGTGNLYGEVAAAIEIRCRDCHGTADALATLRTSGPAAPPGGTDLALSRNSDGRRRFVWRDGRLYQRLILPPHDELEVSQVMYSIDAGRSDYNPLAARAKTLAAGSSGAWGDEAYGMERAHDDSEMACFTCHTAWATSCAGCHLPVQANWKTERNHYEGGETRNFATYNPQVARDQMFQLGRHGEAKDGIIVPVRSTSALVLSSTDSNRNRIYIQQPPVSAGGYSSQAFAPHFAHTVRKTETKTCSDCHVSEANDNNAIMSQLLLQGTNFVNFVGYNAWVGTDQNIEAIQVTEWDEPQAVIGSYLHRYAYPERHAAHLKRSRELNAMAPDQILRGPGLLGWLQEWLGDPIDDGTHGHHSGPVGCLQLRGEYLYVAEGPEGMQVYDVAQVANKNFSERFVTAPFSTLGHDTHVATRDASCVALPTNQPIRPELNRIEDQRKANLEQVMHPIYSYAAITDREEGLILVDVETMGDFEPRNNFLTRALTWNPDGILDGALHAHFAGSLLYVSAARGVVVVDLDDPLSPQVAAVIPLPGVRATVVQFRYLFAVDHEGLQVVDITHPTRPRVVESARVPLADAHRVFVARTYAYVAAGKDGLVIVDVENPETPRVHTRFDADGRLSDARDVVVASTNASLFAYVADAASGLAVVQLTSPELQPKFYGFSPEPVPQLVAWRKTRGAAQALSRGLERDRAVDETGNQIAVFGRIGSRPFNLEEMQALYLDEQDRVWTVHDDPAPQTQDSDASNR